MAKSFLQVIVSLNLLFSCHKVKLMTTNSINSALKTEKVTSIKELAHRLRMLRQKAIIVGLFRVHLKGR